MPTLNWIGKEKVMTHHHDVPFHVLDHKYGFDSSNPGDSSFTGNGNMIIRGDTYCTRNITPEIRGPHQMLIHRFPLLLSLSIWTLN